MTSIVFVHAKGGIPLDHAVSRMAAHGDLHVLSTTALSDRASADWMRACASVTVLETPLTGETLVQAVVGHATAYSADAVISHSEYLLVAVSEAARRLGLRYPGPRVEDSRDKHRMRSVWNRAGVAVPRFVSARSREEAVDGFDALRPPVLLKPAWGAGSVGQVVVHDRAHMATAWDKVTATLDHLATHGLGEKAVEGSRRHFVIEEVIVGDRAAWFGDLDGVADYVSVEGFVRSGKYHPVAVTARLPYIGPYIEMGSFAPCPLSATQLAQIESTARAAVDALGLQDCGTHTELKLTADGPVLIESAARLAGSAITEVVERVHGVDLVGAVTQVLLGQTPSIGTSLARAAPGMAAAELSLIGATAAGRPWSSPRRWDPAALLSPMLALGSGTRVRSVEAMTVASGTVIAPYEPELGITNCAGMLVLTAPDVKAVTRDARSVFDGFEHVLEPANQEPI